MGKRLVSLVLCLALVMTGCNATQGISSMAEQTGMMLDVDRSYVDESLITLEDPKSSVRVLVDRNGYQTGRTKKAFFISDQVSDEFRVIDMTSKKEVYKGQIKKGKYDEARKLYISEGDFSSVDLEGTYFLETDVIGRSYEFSIRTDKDEQLFYSMLDKQVQMTPEDSEIVDVAMSLDVLLLALKCHGTVFSKDNSQITWILKVADWMLSKQDKDGSVGQDYEKTGALSGIMAMCAAQFDKYDAKIAYRYEKASQEAWNWMQKQSEEVIVPEVEFYAASKLFYLQKGAFSYRNKVTSFIQQNEDSLFDDKYMCLGVIQYLISEQGTDRDFCSEIMRLLVDETEKVSGSVKNDAMDVSAVDIDRCMLDILMVCFMDYITPSNEYIELIENLLHYLGGKNAEGCDYLEDSSWLILDEESEHLFMYNSILIYCFSDLVYTFKQ